MKTNIKSTLVIFTPFMLFFLLMLTCGCAEEPVKEKSGVRLSGAADASGDGSTVTYNDLYAEVLPSTEETAEPQAKAEIPKPKIAESGPYPKAVVEEYDFRFGRMALGGESEHVFRIRNEGEADLELVAGKSTCQCTKFNLSTPVLKPGETADLTVRWKLAQVNLQFQHGGPIFTNDPKLPELKFTVRGAVDRAIHLVPNAIWEMENVTYGQKGKYEGYVASSIYEHFELDSAISKSGLVEVQVEKVDAEKAAELNMLSGYRVTVTLPADHPPGILEDTLTFKPDKVDSAAQIGFKAVKQGPIAIVAATGGLWISSDNKLRLGRFPAKQGKKARLVLAVNDKELDSDFEVTEVISTPPILRSSLTKLPSVTEGVSRFALEVEVPPGSPRGSFPSTSPAKMKIKTNHPGHNVLDLEVSYKSF